MPLPIKIEHRIGVQATPDVIWQVVSDLPGWESWNPLYPSARGEIQFGAILMLDLALPGEATRAIKPQVTDWTPNEQIIWKQNWMGGLLRSTRYIEIEALGPANCIFSNGEIYEGFGLRWFSRKRRRTLKAGFTAMGEAVRDKAEALWRAGGGGTT
jgi:hypothetical protein